MIQGSQGAEVKNIGDQYFGTHWQGSTSDVQAVVDAGIISHPSFLATKNTYRRSCSKCRLLFITECKHWIYFIS